MRRLSHVSTKLNLYKHGSLRHTLVLHDIRSRKGTCLRQTAPAILPDGDGKREAVSILSRKSTANSSFMRVRVCGDNRPATFGIFRVQRRGRGRFGAGP
jgi:hypothetical protein